MVLASIVNTYMMSVDPTCYLEFGVLAIPPIQRFIYSQYYARPELIVLPIAVCQFLIGIELFFDDKYHRLRKIAISSLITFFVGLVFLGLGSGFPSSLFYAFTMANCWPKARSKNEWECYRMKLEWEQHEKWSTASIVPYIIWIEDKPNAYCLRTQW